MALGCIMVKILLTKRCAFLSEGYLGRQQMLAFILSLIGGQTIKPW